MSQANACAKAGRLDQAAMCIQDMEESILQHNDMLHSSEQYVTVWYSVCHMTDHVGSGHISVYHVIYHASHIICHVSRVTSSCL